MNYIVFDLEWNQGIGNKYKKELEFEIIEIAAIKLNNDLEFVDKFEAVIKPVIHKRLHPIIKELTGFTEEELDKGKLFKDVIEDFINWIGNEEYRFCTWATQDLKELQENMRFYGKYLVDKPPLYYYDIQKLFSFSCENGVSRRALNYAVKYLQLEENVEFHRAYGDAYYTAMIMKTINFKKVKNRFSVDTYVIPKKRCEEIVVDFDNYSKIITKGYFTKEELLRQRYVREVRCRICNSKLRNKIDWFTNSTKNYYYIGVCKQHGYVKSKIRVRKNYEKLYFGIKTVKNISKDDMLKIKEMKQNKNKKSDTWF